LTLAKVRYFGLFEILFKSLIYFIYDSEIPQAFHGYPFFHLLSQAKKFKLLGIPSQKPILFCPWLWILPISMKNITSMPNHLRLKV
jgi:hypothetical protein